MLELSCPNCHRKLLVVETATDAASECPACHVRFKPGTARDPPRPDEHVTEQSPYRPPAWDPDDEGYLPPFQLPPPPTRTELNWHALKRVFRWAFVGGCGIGIATLLVLWPQLPGDRISGIVCLPLVGLLMALSVSSLYWLFSWQGLDWPRWPNYAAYVMFAMTMGFLLVALVADRRHSTFEDLFTAITASWVAAVYVSIVLQLVAYVLGRLFKLTNRRRSWTKARRQPSTAFDQGDDFDD
jgi:hypothetical protein